VSVIRKRRTRAHIIADLSVNHVEKRILQCGWVMHRFNPDYGVDLRMVTFDRSGELENGDVRFQIKATDSPRFVASGKSIAVRLEWRDMIYWLNEPMPVILVIYDARSDRAWWSHLNESLRETGDPKMAATHTLRIPLTNLLDTRAVRRFRKLRESAERALEE
jgi:hypothetical protein